MRSLCSQRSALMTSLSWHAAVLLEGHGVASGQALNSVHLKTSPYPKGTIAMQSPYFAALGLDLSPFWPGTLNLSFSPVELQLRKPDYFFRILNGPLCILLRLFRFGRFDCVPLVVVVLICLVWFIIRIQKRRPGIGKIHLYWKSWLPILVLFV
jgi:hypothetical protein